MTFFAVPGTLRGWPVSSSARSRPEGFQGFHDFVPAWESNRLPFGEEQLPIGRHLENAIPPRDQLDGALEFLFDRRRQSGGLWEIVSDGAIFDRDFHFYSLSW